MTPRIRLDQLRGNNLLHVAGEEGKWGEEEISIAAIDLIRVIGLHIKTNSAIPTLATHNKIKTTPLPLAAATRIIKLTLPQTSSLWKENSRLLRRVGRKEGRVRWSHKESRKIIKRIRKTRWNKKNRKVERMSRLNSRMIQRRTRRRIPRRNSRTIPRRTLIMTKMLPKRRWNSWYWRTTSCMHRQRYLWVKLLISIRILLRAISNLTLLATSKPILSVAWNWENSC